MHVTLLFIYVLIYYLTALSDSFIPSCGLIVPACGAGEHRIQ